MRALSSAIDVGYGLVIITIVSAKQVYNDKTKLLNEIEPFCLRFHFPFLPALSHVPYMSAAIGCGNRLK